MTVDINSFIDSVESGNLVSAGETFNELINQRITQSLEDLKVSIGQDIIKDNSDEDI